VRGSVSQLLGSIEAVGGDHGFWFEAGPHLAGAVFLSSAAAWPIKGAWWEGAGF
jgi:hypothetical protein